MNKTAIIVAGGRGIRMGGDIPKQFQLLIGKPLLWHAVKAFVESYSDIQIILVLPAEHLEKGQDVINHFPSHKIQVTTGGETRFNSVKNGLGMIDDDSLVFVHDAVRCLVTPGLIKRCAQAAIERGNAVPAISATDTIRLETSGGNELIDRNKVKLIQTPQVFQSDVLKKAFERPYKDSFTDEATVVESLGIEINLVEGENDNIKITTATDLLIAEKILEKRMG